MGSKKHAYMKSGVMDKLLGASSQDAGNKKIQAVSLHRHVHRIEAMASAFTFHLVGKEPKHLHAVGNVLEQLVYSLESLLSAYASHAELFRINQEAANRPVMCSVAMWEVLKFGLEAWEITEGYFDMGWKSNLPGHTLTQRLALKEKARTVQFSDPELQLDFGGMGKGYALERCKEELQHWGIRDFLLDAGTSSVIAQGHNERQAPWTFALSSPEMQQDLENVALSCSAIPSVGSLHEGLCNPHTHTQLRGNQKCLVSGPYAAWCEVFSTALLAMGRKKAEAYCFTTLPPAYTVTWIEDQQGEIITGDCLA